MSQHLDSVAPKTAPSGPGRGLAAILADLRFLAVEALDAGHPLAAAQIASTADRLDAQLQAELQLGALPPRPDYAPR